MFWCTVFAHRTVLKVRADYLYRVGTAQQGGWTMIASGVTL